jgi:hypothetical protein
MLFEIRWVATALRRPNPVIWNGTRALAGGRASVHIPQLHFPGGARGIRVLETERGKRRVAVEWRRREGRNSAAEPPNPGQKPLPTTIARRWPPPWRASLLRGPLLRPTTSTIRRPGPSLRATAEAHYKDGSGLLIVEVGICSTQI